MVGLRRFFIERVVLGRKVDDGGDGGIGIGVGVVSCYDCYAVIISVRHNVLILVGVYTRRMCTIVS